MTKTVLVVGGAGYVGSHCCKAFAQKGWRVVVFDNLSRGWRTSVRWGDLIEGDILDQIALESALKAVRPDAVAHFAAFAYVGESVSHPGLYYRNNTQGTLNLLEAMRACDVKKLVFSSSCATYGLPIQTPIDETHRQSPINPYGWSKFMVERMIEDYGVAHGLRAVMLRYFNAAGADIEGEIGERHDPETHVIPLAIQSALDPDHCFTIFGDDFDTRDGTALRDYVHVTDLAAAHCLALDYLIGGGPSDVFNLGTGYGTTVREIVQAVERIAGRALPVTIGPRRAGDPPALVADSGKASAALDWTPVHSDIDIIIQTAWRWHAQGRVS